MGSLMSPGAATAGPKGPNLAGPSTFGAAATAPEDRRANRNFLADMLGIVIRDRHPSGGTTDAGEALWGFNAHPAPILMSSPPQIPAQIARHRDPQSPPLRRHNTHG